MPLPGAWLVAPLTSTHKGTRRWQWYRRDPEVPGISERLSLLSLVKGTGLTTVCGDGTILMHLHEDIARRV